MVIFQQIEISDQKSHVRRELSRWCSIMMFKTDLVAPRADIQSHSSIRMERKAPQLEITFTVTLKAAGSNKRRDK
ncbi:hypothetical protein KIN20_000801 [Parelaphostrongylus tenuis]|uniref:Uncharacterized protein n=1 Tax=Parelaphostrongylus tenuis TaxID=148309 RepID=A0AAD5ML64_PARTN|nr:hypothetical protein KIN20_000801 [Parelaphostrongylus tenuis]